ncbi:MAG: hypothetical protein ABI591_29865 [Kofleriaceae bacterium]
MKPGGATNFRGKPFAINPDAVAAPIHDTPSLLKDMNRLVAEGKIDQSRVDKWSERQITDEGVHTKPGEPLKARL